MVFDPFGDFQTRGYLRNRLNIRDRRAMQRAEHLAFTSHLEEALQGLASQEALQLQDVLGTHQRLFGSLYPWAGQDRLAVLPEQAVGKGGDFEIFALPMDIHRAIQHALQLGHDAQVLLQRPGEVMGYLAFAHPFLEGNGRTLMTLHADLMRRAGAHIDWRQIGQRAYLDALTQELRAPGQGHLDGLLRPHVKAGALEVPATRSCAAHGQIGEIAEIGRALAGSLEIARFAQDLVREHQVDATPSALDAWAGHVSRLSDAEVELEATQQRLLALARSRVLTTTQALQLQLIHFEQTQQSPTSG